MTDEPLESVHRRRVIIRRPTRRIGVLAANQIRRGVAKRLLFPLFEILAEQRVRQFSQAITLTRNPYGGSPHLS